ncbi:ClbS/DfsB family four-helix bundle protein [Tenacibaculum sp. nBUS_03]|uniref:ClbS/DfsB family four-helix bundle protein n=1 Tax=Tenacibaculum sp. nBUS_03 TaxID=3395320 RepID=UPI003EBFB220
MAVPKNKAELIFEIESSYSKLKKDLENISLEFTKVKELEGHSKGTKMSVSDLVAYLIGWGELVLKWNRKKENGEAVNFPETGYKWNELGKLAQKFYLDYEKLNYLELLIKLDETIEKLKKLIEHNTNEELYEKPWYGKWTKGKMIQLNSSSPYKNARSRVRKWKKSK